MALFHPASLFLIFTAALAVIVFVYFGFPRVTSTKSIAVDWELDFAKNNYRWLLALLFLFALATRFYGLEYPPDFYFDEKYHAFSAQELSRGNMGMWKLASPAPEGFAYSWDHPPVPKLIMATSISLFGEHAIAWRMPGAILGALCVLFVFGIGLVLFQNYTLSLLAAFLLTMDGLFLSISRTGLNDIYVAAFSLFCIYFFLKEKHFWAALFLGLAASSKWSGFFVVPVLASSFFLLKQTWRPSLAFYFFLVPLIYMASYTGYFLAGHDLTEWITLQKAALTWHLHVVDKNIFASPWWSWPLALKPLRMLGFQSSTVAGNIFAGSNPFMSYFAIVALPWGLFAALSTRNLRSVVLFLIFAGLYLPWAFFSRSMFIYYFLPCVPFACLIVAWSVVTSPRPKQLVMALVAVSFSYFVLLYPAWTGLELERHWAAKLKKILMT